jgi:hypothetical protein
LSNKGELISNYLSSNNISNLFNLLVFETILCKARINLIEEKIKRCRELFIDMENSSYSADSIVRIQTVQLDTISSLFMILEDFLSYSHYLNATKIELLPDKILDESTVTWKHLGFLRNLSIDKTYDYLLLPRPKKMTLTSEEKRFVSDMLKMLVHDIHDKIGRITGFFVKYNRIYAKYKHVFSAMVGTYAVENNNKMPRIFIRDRYENKKDNTVEEPTYVIPSTLDAFRYYDELKNDISTVFLYLLEAHIQSMQNCGQPFLMPDFYCIAADKKPKWLEIAKKVNFFTGSLPNLNLRINIKERLVESMLNGLSQEYIFKIKEDIAKHKENTSKIEMVKK